MEKGNDSFDEVTVLAFRHPVLFRSLGILFLVEDAKMLEKISKLIVDIFTAIVSAEQFDGSAKLILNHELKTLKSSKRLKLLF